MKTFFLHVAALSFGAKIIFMKILDKKIIFLL